MLERLFLEHISQRLSDSRGVSGTGLDFRDLSTIGWVGGEGGQRQEGRGGRMWNTTRMCWDACHSSKTVNHAIKAVTKTRRGVLVMSPLVAASSWWMLNTIFLFVHRVVEHESWTTRPGGGRYRNFSQLTSATLYAFKKLNWLMLIKVLCWGPGQQIFWGLRLQNC